MVFGYLMRLHAKQKGGMKKCGKNEDKSGQGSSKSDAASQHRTPEVDVEELAVVFAQFDKEGRWVINSRHLGKAMRMLGENLSEVEIVRIMKEANIHEGSTLAFSDFVRVMNLQYNQTDLESDIESAFHIFDGDGDGRINAQELRHMLTNFGNKLSEKEADELLREVNVDGDGSINIKEFVHMILS